MVQPNASKPNPEAMITLVSEAQAQAHWPKILSRLHVTLPLWFSPPPLKLASVGEPPPSLRHTIKASPFSWQKVSKHSIFFLFLSSTLHKCEPLCDKLSVVTFVVVLPKPAF
ncbi:hypothetical protein Salat_2814900 [Sesamum alatum]|uniref:Uncharacterized protein n=1 Tax=Sesamum alatum TaxID=300844 RepID=A0AAE2C9K8_9LAMI|nr:hypothetical protein Salat_2814900 [Sesamum alatum]